MKNDRKTPSSSILSIGGRTQEKLRSNMSLGSIPDPLANVTAARLFRRRLRLLSSNRRITVSADMYVEDDETFGSNETVRRQQTNSAILSTQGIAQTVMVFEVRMGGEIRVEFTVTASLVDTAGNAIINGEVKLYEGTSESTGDLDGVREFQLYCPAGASLNHFVRVNNDDEGGDFATININITNQNA
jgi:hypothetical protein